MRDKKIKIVSACFFFALGFAANGLLERVQHAGPVNVEGEERYPVNPDDFDSQKIIEAIERDRSDWQVPPPGMESEGASIMGEIAQREDEKFVYYEIPINQSANANHELKVEIKEGIVRIAEVLKGKDENSVIETSAERMFSLDPSLDSSMAEVKNLKDKITIKIPKKRI